MNKQLTRLHASLIALTSPKLFYQKTTLWHRPLLAITALFLTTGIFSGLALTPTDYQQGDAFRVMYIHVPCAAFSLLVYVSMAVSALFYLVWKLKLADLYIKAAAPIGAIFTGLALLTGAIWGKPMWGTWWIWDARLTSELILLFLYLGYMALRAAIPTPRRAAQASAILLLVGVVDIPIIHYSVVWWNTLHQGSTLFHWGKPTIAPTMLYPVLIMLAGFFTYTVCIIASRLRYEILSEHRNTHWVQEIHTQ